MVGCLFVPLGIFGKMRHHCNRNTYTVYNADNGLSLCVYVCVFGSKNT